MKPILQTIGAAILLILVIIFFPIGCNGQSEYDTSLYKQCVVTEIKPVFVSGGRAWKVTYISGNEQVIQKLNRYPKDLKEKECTLMSRDIWNELLTNKNETK